MTTPAALLRRWSRRWVLGAAVELPFSDAAAGSLLTQPLPSWRRRKARERILAFIEAVSAPRSPGIVSGGSTGQLIDAFEHATQRGWTVVSMKDDWKRVF